MINGPHYTRDRQARYPIVLTSQLFTFIFPRTRHRFRRLATGILLALCALYAGAALDPAALQQQLASRFGSIRTPLLNDWLNTIQTARSRNDEARLKQINEFINRRIVFDDDTSVWGQSDYWATPLETIGQGRDDCEDFAIIKYVSLRQAGIPSAKLRLVYVKAQLKTPDGPNLVAHMVLAYYATPNAEPLVLDNLDPVIRPASQRSDLKPVFSFNAEGIFAGVSGKEQATSGGLGRLSRWEDALHRIRVEGFE